MVFQDPYQTLNPRMRVRAIVAEPLLIAGTPDAGRVDRALEDVGLPPGRFADRFPHKLSGGQRQRVAIAASLVLDPDALICDEPVSMLDVSVRAQVLKILMDLRSSRSLALLFITHDLGLAWTLCDRIAVMYLGRIVSRARPPRSSSSRATRTRRRWSPPCRHRAASAACRLREASRPDAAHIPPGCRLHPRCPHRFEPCDSEDPPLLDAGAEEHRAACLLLRSGRPSGSVPA